MKRMIVTTAILAVLVSVPAALPAAAQEVTLFGGVTKSITPDEKTYAWKLEYRQGLGEHFGFTYSWLNEGHVTDHHRDGHSLQLWARENVFDRRLSVSLGAGAIRYYDTSGTGEASAYNDVHGFAGLVSLDVAAYLGKRWILRAEVNRTFATSQSIDTWDFMAGLGYQLTPPDEPGPRAWPEKQAEPTTHNEVTAFVGQTVVNSFDSSKSVATSLEYRRGLSRYFDVSASFLYEGDSRVVRRGGFIIEGWFGRAFLHDRLALSLGVGVYLAVDKREAAASGDQGGTVAAIITPSVSYRFAKHWDARLSWNRIATTYDKDTDVFQLGVGYRF
ncbi:MAG: hypothetical protein ACHQPI_01435 [Thermoanaerobaculia bacterium]